MTRRQQIIEQVAGIIYDIGMRWNDAQRINENEGWSFQVRWHDGEYTSSQSYTMIEGERLSEANLSAAWAQAERWRNGHYSAANR